MFFQRLSTKFSLLLLILFLLSSGTATVVLSNHLNKQAEQAVKERAEILLSTLQAARDYTQTNIQPVLESRSASDDFFQESIPTFAAKAIFSDFQRQSSAFAGFSYQDFAYKEAAVNPTSPKDKADDFESNIFAAFKSMQPNDKRMSGYRIRDGKKFFYLARPLYMKDASCLACHSTAARAPAALLEMYGENGLGWQLGDVVAAQMIYVPADSIFERGRENLWTMAKLLLSIFAAVFFVVNLLLWRTVTQPLTVLTRVAKQISRRAVPRSQKEPIQAYALAPLMLKKDESGQLARAFDYMVQVLSQRERDLQRAVRMRTRSLEAEMQQRQTAQDALQTYAHAINHDLRNLVMGISMVVQGLLRHQKESVSGTEFGIEVEPTALTMIKKSCDRQLNLMHSLVDVRSSEIWRTVLQPESVGLRKLIQDLEERYHTKLKAHSAQLKTEIPESLPLVQADPSQLKRVFENLVDNALKYNASQPLIISIQANVLETTQGKRIRCVVADDGVGLKAEDAEDLFKIYARGHSDRQTLGDGLGLYICRKIIDAHGGNIGIDNTASGGATFWFTLPV